MKSRGGARNSSCTSEIFVWEYISYSFTVNSKSAGGDTSVPTLEVEMLKNTLTFQKSAIDIRTSQSCPDRYDDLNEVDICSLVFNQRRTVAMVMGQTGRQVCDILLDQTILPGVGNIIKNEALLTVASNQTLSVCKKWSEVKLFCDQIQHSHNTRQKKETRIWSGWWKVAEKKRNWPYPRFFFQMTARFHCAQDTKRSVPLERCLRREITMAASFLLLWRENSANSCSGQMSYSPCVEFMGRDVHRGQCSNKDQIMAKGFLCAVSETNIQVKCETFEGPLVLTVDYEVRTTIFLMYRPDGHLQWADPY